MSTTKTATATTTGYGLIYFGGDAEFLNCPCGNSVMQDGFSAASGEYDLRRALTEDEQGDWDGVTYLCNSCDSIQEPVYLVKPSVVVAELALATGAPLTMDYLPCCGHSGVQQVLMVEIRYRLNDSLPELCQKWDCDDIAPCMTAPGMGALRICRGCAATYHCPGHDSPYA